MVAPTVQGYLRNREELLFLKDDPMKASPNTLIDRDAVELDARRLRAIVFARGVRSLSDWTLRVLQRQPARRAL